MASALDASREYTITIHVDPNGFVSISRRSTDPSSRAAFSGLGHCKAIGNRLQSLGAAISPEIASATVQRDSDSPDGLRDCWISATDTSRGNATLYRSEVPKELFRDIFAIALGWIEDSPPRNAQDTMDAADNAGQSKVSTIEIRISPDVTVLKRIVFDLDRSVVHIYHGKSTRPHRTAPLTNIAQVQQQLALLQPRTLASTYHSTSRDAGSIRLAIQYADQSTQTCSIHTARYPRLRDFTTYLVQHAGESGLLPLIDD